MANEFKRNNFLVNEFEFIAEALDCEFEGFLLIKMEIEFRDVSNCY